MVSTGSEQQFEPFLVPLSGRAEALRAIVEPVLFSLGLELVQLFLVHGSHRDQVRLFVDRRDGAVSMADLERANRVLGDLLDVEDQQRKLFAHSYELEVGSPGLDRPLTKRSHFERAAGQQVRVKLKEPKDGQKSFAGTLETLEDGVAVDGRHIRYDEIAQANVVFQFDQPQKKKARR